MEGCIIHEVLISPLAASGMTYEVLISQFLPGRLDLRGFDLRKDNIYTIYIMYIRGFDLASDTQTAAIYEVLIFSTTRSGGFMHEVLISLLA